MLDNTALLAVSPTMSFLLSPEVCNVTSLLPPFPAGVERLEEASLGMVEGQRTLVVCGGMQVRCFTVPFILFQLYEFFSIFLMVQFGYQWMADGCTSFSLRSGKTFLWGYTTSFNCLRQMYT